MKGKSDKFVEGYSLQVENYETRAWKISRFKGKVQFRFQQMLSELELGELHKRASEAERSHNMDRIRRSLRHFPLLSRNKTLVQKKLSINSDALSTLSQTSQPDSLISQQEELAITATFQHAELFAQKYELLEKLGEGSNGVVHRCRKLRNGQEFAVKSFMFDDQQLLEIKNNFLMIKSLSHPHLVRYEALYIDMKKHACWLVMELVPAPSLARWSPQNERQLQDVAQQLLDTLHYLHQRVVTHRDVKLENILYDARENKLKLIDYGICRKHKRRGAKIDMLTITGTLYYRAPQMFTGGGYGEKVDVWAAGVLLYKLVVGVTPFESQYHSKTITNITSAQPVFGPVFDNYSNRLRGLITRMLVKNPVLRLSAAECLRDSWFIDITNALPFHKGSYDSQEDELLLNEEGSRSPLIGELGALEVRSYVRKINGDEYHCIDSEQETPMRSHRKCQRSQTLDPSVL